MKVIYSGLEGSGKSLKLAMTVTQLVERNSAWYELTKIRRGIASNMLFTREFEQWAIGKNVPIGYWEQVEELITLENCDVIIDEVGNYFDSRMWTDLSLDVRRWLTQGSKAGIEIYGSAQDFAQVDKAFRRLVNHLFQITKVIGSPRPAATKPPVTRIWGMCLVQELDPAGYSEDKKKFDTSSIIPTFFFIRKEYCDIFDTKQKIKASSPMPLKHVTRVCERHGLENDGCHFTVTKHI